MYRGDRRENLFRGKRIDNGEWVEGSYVRYGYTGEEKSYVVPGYASALYAFEVDPDTVGERAGIPDKIGRMIFDGDVLRATVNAKINKRTVWYDGYSHTDCDYEEQEVHWSVEHKIFNSRMGFFVYGKDRRFSCPLSRSVIFNKSAIVVGNIHDNPELVKP